MPATRSQCLFILSSLCLCASVVSSSGCANRSGPRPVKIAFMPKLIGIPYFNACQRGAEEAAKELNIELLYNGPTETDVTKQIGMIEQWTASVTESRRPAQKSTVRAA